jgi:hypothetical protein
VGAGRPGGVRGEGERKGGGVGRTSEGEPPGPPVLRLARRPRTPTLTRPHSQTSLGPSQGSGWSLFTDRAHFTLHVNPDKAFLADDVGALTGLRFYTYTSEVFLLSDLKTAHIKT